MVAYMAVKIDTLDAMCSANCLAGSVPSSPQGCCGQKLLKRMQGNNSQGSGCFSRSRSHISWVRTSSGRGSKVPQWCGCGLRPVLWWSGTEQNPDRPFYGCPNYNADGEEDESTAWRAHRDTKSDQVKINLGFRVSNLEAEIRVLKCWGLGLSLLVVVCFCIVGYGLGIGK
ncbi:hypothetical protein PIB30_037548 [Stylosanthes scabra]|uniref:Zinc finger GRF-type domain-containing protein n=1 Tax=Stylosanthes scabra TaxID=79078 RepID=A0ABU6SFE0_9FABA|nr:hypothetical protein [Stylosanthes scabra]